MRNIRKYESKLMNDMNTCHIEIGELAIVWLGQAGFMIKDSREKKYVIDPYLSHYGEEVKNFVRLSPILVEGRELDVDHYITTHKHFDHFDYNAIPEVVKNFDTNFYGPVSCVEEFEKIVNADRKMKVLEEGRTLSLEEEAEITPTYADHGTLEPDAIGLKLKIDNISFYITGDTSYRPDKWKDLKSSKPDLLIASVNGEFGNLSVKEGVSLANFTEAKSIIPCHFWTFREHKGSPHMLEEEKRLQNCDSDIRLLTASEIYVISKKDDKLEIIKYKK